MDSNYGFRELGGVGQEDTMLNAGLLAAQDSSEGFSESPLVGISKNALTVFSNLYFVRSPLLLSLGNSLRFSGNLRHRAAYR